MSGNTQCMRNVSCRFWNNVNIPIFENSFQLGKPVSCGTGLRYYSELFGWSQKYLQPFVGVVWARLCFPRIRTPAGACGDDSVLIGTFSLLYLEMCLHSDAISSEHSLNGGDNASAETWARELGLLEWTSDVLSSHKEGHANSSQGTFYFIYF